MQVLLEDGGGAAVCNGVSGIECAECGAGGGGVEGEVGGGDGEVGQGDEGCVSPSRLDILCLLLMLGRVEDLTDMTSLGLGLPRNTFRDAGKYGYVPSFPFNLT